VSPGKQDYILTGNMSTVTKESVTLMIALISNTSKRIGEALGLRAAHKLRLMRGQHDLHVHSVTYEPITPSYQQGAIYVAIVGAMVQRRCRPRTAIFGDVGTYGSLTRWVYRLPVGPCCLRLA
jgi:ATP-dependent Lon protease